MLTKICSWLEYNSDKKIPEFSLREIFGDDCDFLMKNFMSSLCEFANFIDCDGGRYEFSLEEKEQVHYTEIDTAEPKTFSRDDARLWEFDAQKFAQKTSTLLHTNSAPIPLENDTDGYYLGSLDMGKKYAIFLCFGLRNFEISAQKFIGEKISPLLFYISGKQPSASIQKYLAEKHGAHFHITKLLSMNSEKSVHGGNIKSLLNFRGTKQNVVFNLGDLQHNLPSPTWSDLTISVIDRDKIHIGIGSASVTFRYYVIPYFKNSRRGDEPKECWFTLQDFAKGSLLYSDKLKNRLSELRKFFAEFKIKGDPFERCEEADYKGTKRLKKSTSTIVRPRFKMKLISEEYKPDKR